MMDHAAEDLARLSQSTASPHATGPRTTGPATKIRRRNRLIQSCLECRRRKLKCDEQHPCTNCTRFIRDCVYLAPALDVAAQQKITEIKERMGSLERTLEDDVARKQRQSRSSMNHQPVSLPGE